jgi:hypothetical protein
MLEIPLPTDTYNFRINITLDGDIYFMEFNWNGRLNFWTYDLILSDNTPLVQGIRLAVSYPLSKKYVYTKGLSQNLFLYDTTEKNEEPTFQGLGRRWRLMYGDPV